VLPTLVKEGIIGGLLDRATRREKDEPADDTPARTDDSARADEEMKPDQPAAEPDPVGGLFDLVEKQLKERGESDREKRERREQRQKEREKQKQQGSSGEGVSGSEPIGRQPARSNDRE
jgi:hypothetical protein